VAAAASLLSVFASAALAKDVFVLLSGGHSPFDNNYSQYLQARAVADYFERHYPTNSVWIFFGAGNVSGKKPVLADVCQATPRDNLLIPSWLPGALPHNLPARRSIFLGALRNEILPAIADGGTLFLFVGDHGSRTKGRNAQSEIDLWSLSRDEGSDHGWREDEDETLSVSDLRSALTNGIGKGQVVFVMTQCHAGGFHYLAIAHEMTPNPKWFTDVPAWAIAKTAPAFPNAAGFTATDEFSLASGCDPDPDPARWAGYERYLPEQLMGMDLFTLKLQGKGLRSFAEAHIQATLRDATIDRPASTSDQYLERWANLIETRLSSDPNLASHVQSAVTAYERALNGAPPKVADAAYRERQAQFQKFTEKLCGTDPEMKDLLLKGTRKQLEDAVGPDMDDSGNTPPPPNTPRRRPGQFRGRRRLWRETIRPAWKKAVESNQATNVLPAAMDFEKHLLDLEEEGENLFSPNAQRTIEEEIYWQGGFADPQTVNFSKADAITLWGLQRREKILEWAKTNSALEVRTAAARLLEMPANRNNQDSQPSGHEPMHESSPAVDMETAVARTLFYRRVLGAWEFLFAVQEQPALDRLRELTELERTKLP